MSKLLTQDQKNALIILVKPAFERQAALGNTADFTLDTFRTVGVYTATGGEASGLRTARNEHFLKIKGYFLMLAGHDAEAVNADIEDGKQPRKRILWVIDETAKKAGFAEAYILPIVADKFGGGANWRDDLTEQQLIQLSITLRNRAAARAKKPAAKPAK